MSVLGLVAVSCFAASTAFFTDREKDWRIGPVVYQVFVDRFAPPHNLEAKRSMLRPPRTLKSWNETPKPGKLIPGLGLYSHELEFWGGDFAGLRSHLDYVSALGADVLYLNPIHKAFSNHKYDADDFAEIDPLYGTRREFLAVIDDVHKDKMRLILDGVFNHMGKNSTLFQDATSSTKSRHRDWFYFDPKYPAGYRSFAGASNLPALNLENHEVQSYLWSGQNSIVRKYLADGADGWRLDVGFELGPKFLTAITEAAHKAKPGCEVVGEVSGYPSGWFPAVDGVFDFFSIAMVEKTLRDRMTGGAVGLALNHMVLDAGIEHVLRSWLITDNHDTDRLASDKPAFADRKLIWAMQMFLPGAPVLYYGTELGMEGAGDPQNRAPMRWDLANDTNENLNWVKKLIRIRRANPALRYGDFLALDTTALLAFVRTTDKVLDTRLVVLNPTNSPIKETFPVRVGHLMSYGALKDVFTGESLRVVNGLATITAPAKSVRMYQTDPMSETAIRHIIVFRDRVGPNLLLSCYRSLPPLLTIKS